MPILYQVEKSLPAPPNVAAARAARRYRSALHRSIPALKREMNRNLIEFFKIMVRNHSLQWSRNSRGRARNLYKRSGRLLQFLRSRQTRRIEGVRAGSLRAVVDLQGYAAVQERGAIIRPRRSKFLAIPTKEALTPRGTPKRRGPRDWRGTFVKKSKTRRNAFLIYQRYRKGIRLLYVLRKRVVLKRRLGAQATIARVFRDFPRRASLIIQRRLDNS